MAEEKVEKQYQTFPLGVKGRPFPMMMPATSIKTDEGTQFIPPHLGALEEPVMVSSRRTYAEMMGLAYRDMPAPGMLRVFYEGLALRSPQSERKTHFTLGAPGVGKSFLAKHAAKMRDERGAIVVDCGGKNLDELVFETILDMDKGKSFYQKIEEKARNGELNPTSVKLLRENLGAGFSEENGKMAFDWEVIGNPLNEDDKSETKDRLGKAMSALKEVAKLEGMESEGGGIGLKTRKGPIIVAWEEGRELILDEYNKGKPGTDSSLQTIWQVFIGEVKEHTQKGGAGQSFTFNRKEMKPGFFVTLTGNGTEDGAATQELSESAYSRLRPDFIPPLELDDWQHRICQILTDVPISTLYKCSENEWSKKPKAFGSFVSMIQTLGRSEKEVQNIPELKKKMVENWQGVMKASEKLATFYDRWSKLIDPANENLPAELSMEVDEPYKNQVGVGMRMMIAHLNNASKSIPAVTSSENSNGFDLGSDWNQIPEFSPKVEAPGAKFGTNLSRVILEEIDKTTRGRGKPHLHKALMKLAADCGIVEASFEEAAKSKNQKNISDLLDLDKVKEDVKVTEETLETQSQFCDYLRGKYPELSPKNDDIVSALEIETGIKSLLKEKELLENSPRDRYLILPNTEFLESASGKAEPFILVPTIDTIPTPEEVAAYYESDNPTIVNRVPPSEELLGHETFLNAITMPSLSRSNINSLWNKAISFSVGVDNDNNSGDESITIAQKESKTGFATMTVACGKEDSDETVTMNILLKEKGAERAILITGDAPVSKEISATLAKQGITYVELNKNNSLQLVNKELTKMLGEAEERKSIEKLLVAAHRYRSAGIYEDEKNVENSDSNDKAEKEVKLSDAFTKNAATTPVYLIKNKRTR